MALAVSIMAPAVSIMALTNIEMPLTVTKMAPDTRSHNLPSILYVCVKEQYNFGLGHLKYTEKKQNLHGIFYG